MMAEVSDFETTDCGLSRPSLAQVKAIVEFIKKHPNLAKKGLRYSVHYENIKKLWIELSNIVNSMKGAVKSTKGWIKFWADKRRNILMKQKQIKAGRLTGKLTYLEQKIIDITSDKNAKLNKPLTQNLCNGDENSVDDSFCQDENSLDLKVTPERLQSTEADKRCMNIMEKMIEAMDHQARALVQMAQAKVKHSQAMTKIAEASHKQALAVDRLAGTFDTINNSVCDVRNAIVSIDYTTKRCFAVNPNQADATAAKYKYI